MSIYLKSMTLNGFKSFAAKTYIEFTDGITGIVGPNGCGKSNVVEAIKWVLGEQSAKNMRGNRMEDVIFNGTRDRTAQGMAEVTLTFNNENHWLPIDFSEVTIGRRIFRSGESQYYLNKSRIRLKEMVEMFLDTGVGRDSYAIFEQGKIDRLLSESPLERRILFEDFAGISKFKFRKDEAERKLTRSEENLERVNDLIIELEKEVKNLQKQADDASKYNELREKLRDLEIKFEALRIRNIQNEINIRKEKIEQHQEQKSPLNENLRQREDGLKKTEKDIFEREGMLSELSQKNTQREQEQSRVNSQLASQRTRQQSIKERLESMEARLKDESERAKRLQEELTQKTKDKETINIDKVKMEEDLAKVQEKIDDVFTRIKALDEGILKQSRDLGFDRIVSKDDIDHIREAVITHHTKLENFRASLEEKWENQRRYEAEKKQKDQHHTGLVNELDALKTQLEEILARIEKGLQNEAQLKQQNQDHSKEIRDIQNELKTMDKVIMESLEKQSLELKKFTDKKPLIESRLDDTMDRLQKAVDKGGAEVAGIIQEFRKQFKEYQGYYENILGILYSDEGSYTHKENLQTRIEQLTEAIAKNEHSLEKQRAEIRELQSERSDILSSYNKIEYEMNSVKREITKLEDQITRTEETRKNLENQINATSDAINKKQNQVEQIQNIVTAYEQDIQSLRDEKNKHTEKLNLKKVDFARVEEQFKSVSNEIRRVDQQIQDIQKNQSSYVTEKSQALDELDQLAQSIDDGAALSAQLEQEINDSRTQMTKLKEELQNLRQSAKLIETQINDLTLRIQKIEISVTSLQESIEERQQSLNIIVDNTLNTYSIDARKVEIGESDNLDDIARDTKGIRISLSRLGDVNLLAIEQYQDAKERLDFLLQQRRDIEAAMSDIIDLISETNTKSEEQFLTAFQDIRKAFKKIFARLFDGGRADLLLTDKDNVLTSGIEIMAEPPGKKFQSISLFSGGERALVAIAVIFSILYLKPTPFVVLDELDAPLDDDNIERFKKLLFDFRHTSQFILVSHSKSTLEICDTLYGVTMEELGCSKVINVAFDEDNILFKDTGERMPTKE